MKICLLLIILNFIIVHNIMSFYFTGQVSVQRAILTVRPYRSRYSKGVEGFIEESVIRRELSDNFCFYNDKYDSIEGTDIKLQIDSSELFI